MFEVLYLTVKIMYTWFVSLFSFSHLNDFHLLPLIG